MSVLLIAAAYLLGSVSSAVLICRVARLPDPREHGSKNPGATNVLRLGGKVAALGVLVFDVLKGALPVWAAFRLNFTPTEIGFTALAACMGHIFPIFFRFRGGKGVATAFGVLLPMGGAISGIALGLWLASSLLFGYASLSAVVTALLMPLAVWHFTPALTFPVALVCCLLVYRHHDNIQRLWRGQEPKIRLRKSAPNTNL